MRHVILSLLLGIIAIPAAHADEPFALVELFASEGCSSCPPADELLNRLAKEADAQGTRILTVSFAVDYWDYLGWKDPASQAAFTERQQQYAQVLRSSSVYTPQMIVNGREAFVGSDEAKAKQAIQNALRQPVRGNIQATLSRRGQQIEVSYQVSGLSADLIQVALVERSSVSHVTAGENEGRVLAHRHLVREFKTLRGSQGKVELKSAAMAENPSNFAVIVYAQDPTALHIDAASQFLAIP